MNIELLRDYKSNFDEEAVIGKTFQNEKISGNFIAITREEETLKAWFLIYGEEKPLAEEEEDSKKLHNKLKKGTLTNEKQLLSEQETEIKLVDSLEAVVINGKRFTFQSAESRRIMEHSWDAYLLLAHFLEKIPFFGELEEIELEDMSLLELEVEGEYEKIPKECFESKKGKATILLENEPVYKRFSINKKVTFQVGENQEVNLSFQDKESKTRYEAVIERVSLYDVWAEEEKRFEGEQLEKYLEHMTMEEVREMKGYFFKALEETCPKGMYLPVVEYEATEDIILDFYSIEFLQQKVEVHKGSCNTMAFMIRPDKETGLHGGKLHTAVLSPVPKDTKEIPSKLLWLQKKVPVENIKF